MLWANIIFRLLFFRFNFHRNRSAFVEIRTIAQSSLTVISPGIELTVFVDRQAVVTSRGYTELICGIANFYWAGFIVNCTIAHLP